MIHIMLSIFLFSHLAYSDSILLKTNKSRIEGVIEAQYDDQILFTHKGGQEYIQRSLIKEIKIDPLIQNYMFKADFYEKNQNYHKALDYYQFILREQPHIQQAQNGLKRVSEKMYKTSGYKTKSYIRSKNIFNKDKVKVKKASSFFNQLGLRVKNKGGFLTILSVFKGSWGEKNSVHPQDRILSINNTNIQNWTKKKLMNYLNQEKIDSITILKSFKLPMYKKNLFGIKKRFQIKFKKHQGIFIITKINSFVSSLGLQVKDLIISVDNQDAHYLKSQHIKDFIKHKKHIKMEISRELSLSMQ